MFFEWKPTVYVALLLVDLVFLRVKRAKILYADWLRGLQLSHSLHRSAINDFSKTNHKYKQNLLEKKRNCFRNIKNPHQIVVKSLAGLKYNVYFKNYRLKKLHSGFMMRSVYICNFVMLIINNQYPILAKFPKHHSTYY